MMMKSFSIVLGFSSVLVAASSLVAQNVTVTSLANLPANTSDPYFQVTGRLVQAANGDLYGVNFAVAEVFMLSAQNQYVPLAGVESYIRQGPDGNFYGSGFRMTPSGNLTYLHKFTGGADGYGATSGVTQFSDGLFYGTSVEGEVNGGAIYRFSTAGSFELLYAFNPNVDGNVYDGSTLVQASDGNLYGSAVDGGAGCTYAVAEAGCGTLFRYTSSGKFQLLHTFTGGTDGRNPYDLVEASDGALWGWTKYGGDDTQCGQEGCGVIFRLDLQGNFSVVHTVAETGDISPMGVPFTAGPGGVLYGGYEPNAPNDGLSSVNTSGEITNIYAWPPGGLSTGGWESNFLQGSDGNLYSIGDRFDTVPVGGQVFRLNFSPPLAPPVQLSFNTAQVKPGGSFTATYSVNNAFSLSMQQCYGFQNLNGVLTPLGKAPGSYNSTTQLWGGQVTVPAPNVPGMYTYALTCGGVESGYANLQVGSTTATALTVSPNPVTPPGTAVLTATVSSSDGTPGTGSVVFASGGVTLGTAAISSAGVASVTASSKGVPAGSYAVTATYSGGGSYAGSESSVVVGVE